MYFRHAVRPATKAALARAYRSPIRFRAPMRIEACNVAGNLALDPAETISHPPESTPEGCSSRNSPRSSDTLRGFAWGLSARISTVVSMDHRRPIMPYFPGSSDDSPCFQRGTWCRLQDAARFPKKPPLSGLIAPAFGSSCSPSLYPLRRLGQAATLGAALPPSGRQPATPPRAYTNGEGRRLRRSVDPGKRDMPYAV